MTQPNDLAAQAEQQLLQAALRYPDAHEDHPWGETVVKVKGKVFVFLGASEGRLGVTTKLPRTGPAALGLPGIASIAISGTQLSLASLTTVARVDYDSTLDMGETQALRSVFTGTQNLPYTTSKTVTRTNTVEVRETKTTVSIEGVNQVQDNLGNSPTYSQWVEREWYCGYWDCGSKIDYTLDQGYKSLGGFVGTINRPTTTYDNNYQKTSVDVTFPTEHFDHRPCATQGDRRVGGQACRW